MGNIKSMNFHRLIYVITISIIIVSCASNKCGSSTTFPNAINEEYIDIDIQLFMDYLYKGFESDTIIHSNIHRSSGGRSKEIVSWIKFSKVFDDRSRKNSQLDIDIKEYVNEKQSTNDFQHGFKFLDRVYGGIGKECVSEESRELCSTPFFEAKADPSGLCTGMRYYYAYVFIRNSKYIINISERTNNRESTTINRMLSEYYIQ